MRKTSILAVIIFSLFLSGCGLNLLPPEIKDFSDICSNNLKVSGIGYPEAITMLYLDDNYVYDTKNNIEGYFEINYLIKQEGAHILKLKQKKKGVVSAFTANYDFVADLTPPENSLVIDTSVPETMKENTIQITGKANKDTFVSLNSKLYPLDENNNFKIEYSLTEGENSLVFVLEDKVGNKTDVLKKYNIFVDTKPPIIETTSLGMFAKNKALGVTDEYLYIKHGEFWGYFPSVYNMAIEGYIKGKFKNITLDNKKIVADENNEIFKKIPLYLNFGTNKFKVVAEDISGNQSSKYLTIDITPDSANNDIINKLDDIDSKIDNL